MGLVILTPVEDIPQLVTLQEHRDNIGFFHEDHDVLIGNLASTAREDLEEMLNRSLATKTYKFTLDGFPTYNYASSQPRDTDIAINLPRPPLLSVESITYLDGNGNRQTLDEDQYTVDTSTEPGRVFPSPGNSWPQHLQALSSVEVTFVAGYYAGGSEPDNTPYRVKQAIMWLTHEAYQNRGAATEKPRVPSPFVEQLVNRLRVY